MSRDNREILETLRYELNFLEQGGYDHNASGDGLVSPFRTSYSCLNFGDPLRRHACRECKLYQFVPESAQTEEVPCHAIDLGDGTTIARLLAIGDREMLVKKLERWLRNTISQLESEAQAVPK